MGRAPGHGASCDSQATHARSLTTGQGAEQEAVGAWAAWAGSWSLGWHLVPGRAEGGVDGAFDEESVLPTPLYPERIPPYDYSHVNSYSPPSGRGRSQPAGPLELRTRWRLRGPPAAHTGMHFGVADSSSRRRPRTATGMPAGLIEAINPAPAATTATEISER
jgi:hypothetical protein